jgi:hypothetical protein
MKGCGVHEKEREAGLVKEGGGVWVPKNGVE